MSQRKRGERKDRPQDKYQDPRQLFVGQLPLDVTEEGLGNLLSQYGEVEHVQILRGPGGVSRGCGFVHMRDPKNADDAISQLAGKKQIEGGTRPLCVNRGGAKNNEKNYAGTRIYIANISRDSKEEDLRQRFSEYGEIQEFHFMKEFKEYRKTALIIYSAKEEAQRAVSEVHGKIKDGTHPRPLIVRMADSKISLDPQTKPYTGKITMIANPSRPQYVSQPAPIPIPYAPQVQYVVPSHASPYPIAVPPGYPAQYYAQAYAQSSRSSRNRSRSPSPDRHHSSRRRSPSRSPSPYQRPSSSSSRRNGPTTTHYASRSSGGSSSHHSSYASGGSSSRDYKSRSSRQQQRSPSGSPSRSRSRSPPKQQHHQSSRRTTTYTYTTPAPTSSTKY